MNVKVISEIQSARGTVPVGSIINIPVHLLEKLKDKVAPIPYFDKSLPHYCQPGDCWCSAKLPGSDYPTGCIDIGCEYHRGDGSYTERA